MLDGIGKDIRLSLAVFLSILLTAEHDGLCVVDAVNNGIQTLHLLELFSIYVE